MKGARKMSSIFNSFFNLDKENREPSEIKYKNEYKEDDGIVKAKLNVQGVVQGVGFRFTTKKLADQLDVHGIVRNESDGSVYIEAVSKKDIFDEFVSEVAKGPSPSANVNLVVVEYDHSIANYSGFSEQY